ncbi:MAG: NAD(P)/FAD-dependent oxidoreductase, partial [Bacteroidales bacterium]|nr:NAD(P)/FAD-dependent oxidoreductase [Bacteroidales bacterium]
MLKTVEILIPPHASGDADFLKRTIAKKIQIAPSQINHISVLRRSIDARKPPVKLRLLAAVYTGEERFTEIPFTYTIQHVHQSPAVVIIGAGPAGIFAALTLIEHGIKPIILERGKEIQARKLDIAQLNRNHLLNPDSNYCFGEGGAGIFSDGKLYTRATKRGDVKRILNLLVWHGADPDILVDAHPHIGSDKLPPLIGNIRKTILEAGGEIHYNTRAEAFVQKGKALAAVVDQRGTHYEAAQYILATGHSARDIYQLFHNNQWAIEAKPFALGVRVEHPQSLI